MICSRLRLCFRGVVGPRFFNLSAVKLNGASGALSNKRLEETENGFAHKVLENMERYKLPRIPDRLHQEKTTLELNLSDIQWKNLSGNELCRTFTKISLAASAEGTPISDCKFNDMCASIASRCPDLSDSHLKSLLTSLTYWPPCGSSDEPNFYYLWKAIDTAFDKMYKDFKPEKIFEITELWYQLRLIRRSDFVYHGLNKVARRPNRLKSEQIVLLLFYQNVMRTLSKSIQMFPVVERFGEIVHDLTIEEIGVACMGFFKTENPILIVDIVDAIISKLIKNANTVPEITLASIMKSFDSCLQWAYYRLLLAGGRLTVCSQTLARVFLISSVVISSLNRKPLPEGRTIEKTFRARKSADVTYTTNACLSFHASFNRDFNSPHPNMYNFYEVLNEIQVQALRYRLPISLWHRIPELMDVMVTQVDRLTLTSSVHILLILTGSQTIHENILDAVSEKLIKEKDIARMKDLEKVIYPLTLLNYTPKTSKCVFETIVDQLNRPEREVEFTTWPKCLIAILHYLAIKGIFVDHLISRVLDMTLLRSAYGKTNYIIGREVLFLDSTMEIENPNYQGNRLPVDVRNYLSKRYSAYLPNPERKMSKQLIFEHEVIQAAELLTGNKCMPKYLLPNHPRADLVLRLSNNGEFLPLPDDFVSVENFTGPIRSPGTEYWALIPLSRNAFIRNLDGVNGETLAKHRQLTKLGFKPLFVLEKPWPMDGSDSEKVECLKNLIDSSATPS